jgi:hypothetical protein
MVAIWDAAGRMRVQRDNGTIRFQAATNHTHLASSAGRVLRVSVGVLDIGKSLSR